MIFHLLPLILTPVLLLTTAYYTPTDHQTHSPNDLTFDLPSAPDLPNLSIHIKRASDLPPLTIPNAQIVYIQHSLAAKDRLKGNLATYKQAVKDFQTIVANPENDQGYRDILAGKPGTMPAFNLLTQLKKPREIIEHAKTEASILRALANMETRRKSYSSGTPMSESMRSTLKTLDDTADNFKEAVSSTNNRRALKLLDHLNKVQYAFAAVVSHLQLKSTKTSDTNMYAQQKPVLNGIELMRPTHILTAPLP